MMDENKLRQWLAKHPGKSPPEMPEGVIGVIFPGENTKDYTLLSGLFRPCAHTARETLQWLLGRVDAEEVSLHELPRSVKRLHEIPEGISETDCSVFRILDTERNRKLYRVTDNHGKPEYIGYLWKKDFFSVRMNAFIWKNAFIEVCLRKILRVERLDLGNLLRIWGFI